MDAKLKVIRGGKAMKPGSRGRQFISGYVTDTRLMGVIGMELRWDVISDARVKTLNQIFYLDAEEFGLESYTEAFGDNPEAIRVERNRLIGALGGNVVPVTEAEARFILQSYVRINKKYRQSLPAGYENISSCSRLCSSCPRRNTDLCLPASAERWNRRISC